MGHTSVNVAGGYSVDLNTDWKEILVGGAIVSNFRLEMFGFLANVKFNFDFMMKIKLNHFE